MPKFQYKNAQSELISIVHSLSSSAAISSSSEADFRARAADKRNVAMRMVEDKASCREAWLAAGFAAEFALKAYIMRHEGWAEWPSQSQEKDLYTHALRDLVDRAGIDLKALPLEIRAAFQTVLDWKRSHDYVAGRMPRPFARSMVEAAFGANGVVTWLDQQK